MTVVSLMRRRSHHHNNNSSSNIHVMMTMMMMLWLAATTTTTTSSSSRTTLGYALAFSFQQNMYSTTTTAMTTTKTTVTTNKSTTTTTALQMAAAGIRTRGLEKQKDGPTPTEGGMTLYVKAAADGQSVGDCPFAHFVRMVLEEKGLVDYQVKPTTPDGKPSWLVEYYDGKMPALRHGKECYVESGVIADYLEYFFPQPPLTAAADRSGASAAAEQVLEGFFPAVAQFLKDTEDREETTNALKNKLQQFEDHLAKLPKDGGSFLCGDQFSLLDCRVVPQLYHLQCGIDGFKKDGDSVLLIHLAEEYPKLHAYMQRCFARPSFQASQYPAETVLWGWGNARGG